MMYRSLQIPHPAANLSTRTTDGAKAPPVHPAGPIPRRPGRSKALFAIRIHIACALLALGLMTIGCTTVTPQKWVSQLGSLNELERNSAKQNLHKMREEAIPHLLQALQDDDFTIRKHATNLLATAYLKRYPTYVYQGLQHPSHQVRIGVAKALAQAAPAHAKQSTKALSRCLKDAHPWVRKVCLHSLRRFGPLAINTFLGALNSPRTEIKVYAANALGALAKPGNTAVKTALAKGFRDKNYHVRVACFRALRTLTGRNLQKPIFPGTPRNAKPTPRKR